METKEKRMIIRILSCILLLGIGIFLKNKIVSLICYLLSYIIISYDRYIESFQNIKKKEFFDENLLMILATLGAFYLKSYQEGILVILLFQIGEFLSERAISKSKKSITELMDLRVEEIELKEKTKIPVEQAKVGDQFLVRPGDRIPLDGVVVEGSSYLDTSAITGESEPVFVSVGEKIVSGCLNTSSTLLIEAQETYKTSTAQRIMELLEQEEDRKSKTETWIHRFAKVYTPLVLILGLLLFVIPTIMGGEVEVWFYRMLIFIVSSCPCALVISVPLGYFCGIGRASKSGILIKGSKELEDLSKIKMILLDKTGTLTDGVMKVGKVSSKRKKKDFLQLVASCEENSTHPIAQAVKKENKAPLRKVTNYEEFPGKGISCTIGKEKILVGNAKWMEENKIELPEIEMSHTIIYVGVNQEYEGYIEIMDSIKESSYQIKNQKNIVIVSGDKKKVVEMVAKELGIEDYYGELDPEGKEKVVEEYQAKGKVMFVGDGLNDALPLSKADIGVSLANIGTDAALEASDVVLMNNDISKILDAISLSKYTHRKVMQSICFALIVKAIVLFLGIFGLSTMLMAIFADVGVTLISIINVLLIFTYQEKED